MKTIIVQLAMYLFLACSIFTKIMAEEAPPTCAGLPKTEKLKEIIAKLAISRIHALVIFTGFQGEVSEDIPVPSWAKDIFNPHLPGSLTHFYSTMSNGAFTLTGSYVNKIYSSNHPASHYTRQNFGEFNWEILEKVDQEIDFSQYDNNGPDGIANSGDDDGYVDFIFILVKNMPQNFIAGSYSGTASLGLNSFVTDDRKKGGGKIKITVGTTQDYEEFANTIGGMAHELGHILGLVMDLYDRSYCPSDVPEEDSAGIGKWGLMGHGTTGWRGNDGPNPFCAYSLQQLGWIGKDNSNLVVVRKTMTDVVIEPLHKGGKVYKIPFTKDEYFLISNRQSSGCWYDRHIPGSGLLIWHVVPSNGDNDTEEHKLLDLECADGLFRDKGFPNGKLPDPNSGKDNLDFWAHDSIYRQTYNGNMGDATDIFDGKRFTSFTLETNPNSRSDLYQLAAGIEVANIRSNRANMIVDFRIPTPVKLYNFELVDRPFGNGDGIANPCELVALGNLTLRNWTAKYFSRLTMTISTDDSFVNPDRGFPPSPVEFSDIDSMAVSYPKAGPQFLISSDCPDGHTLAFKLIITDDVSTWEDELTILVKGSDQFPPVIQGLYANPISVCVGNPVVISCSLFEGGKLESVVATIFQGPDWKEIASVELQEDSSQPGTFPGAKTYKDFWIPPIESSFRVSITATDACENTTSLHWGCCFTSKAFVKSNPILLICSTEETTEEQAVLQNSGILYDQWNIEYSGDITSSVLDQYSKGNDLVIWPFAFQKTSSRHCVRFFLNSGGRLFVYNPTGASFLKREDRYFLNKYLCTDYVAESQGMVYSTEVWEDLVSQVVNIPLSQGYEKLSVFPPAEAILVDRDGDAAGLCLDTSVYKLVFLSFDFGSIQEGDVRNKLLVSILNWLKLPKTSIEQDPALFYLWHSYPNPFEVTTKIEYRLPGAGHTKVSIYNILGQKVAEPIDELQGPGHYAILWNGTDKKGRKLASGIYFCRLDWGNLCRFRKVALLR